MFAAHPKVKQGKFQRINWKLFFTGQEKVSNYCQQLVDSTLHPRKAHLKAIRLCNNARKRGIIINALNL